MSYEKAKEAAGRKAAEWIESGMIVGLGTGSTANYFIRALIERVQKGLRIEAVASSQASASLAGQGTIPLLDINDAPRIDLTVDGADEIDSQKRMIKGGGGAHTREKILAAASKEMVVIVDESKLVPSIGRHKLPVEVLFYGSPATRAKIEQLNLRGQWRQNPDQTLYLTDNGNLIFDIQFDTPPDSPETIDQQLHQIPGVVETGFFFHLAGRVIIGHQDGSVTISNI